MESASIIENSNLLDKSSLQVLDKKNKNKTNSTTSSYYQLICNKKWLILGIIFLILLLGYIYYSNISLVCPFSLSITQKKKNINTKSNKSFDSDNCEDLNDDSNSENEDNWNLEDEMSEYMKKQQEYLGH